MKLLFFTSLFYLYINVFSQNDIKTYNGIYGNNGTAIYQYYEDENLNRYYHGDFIYKNKYGTLHGNFINDKKNGKWECTYYEKLNAFEVKKVNIIGYYDNGNLTGKWTYIKHLYYNNTETLYEIHEAQFDSSRFVNKIKYFSKKGKKVDSLTLFVNTKGLIEGTYRIYSTEYGNDFFSNITFNDGIVSKLTTIKNSTGEIVEKFDIKEIVDTFINKYNNNNINIYNKVYSCDRYVLTLSKSDYSTRFGFDGTITNNGYEIYNLKEQKYHDSQYNFNFISMKDFKSYPNRYGNEKINSEIVFWLNLTSGDFEFGMKENRGINYSLTFPKSSFYYLRITPYETIKEYIINN